MWLKIIRQNISHLARRAKGSASIEQKNGNGNNKANKTNNNGAEVNRNEEQNGSPDKSLAKKKPVVPGGGPLLQQTEISTSQLDFFRMLDEKIESGPDYDESSDASQHRREHITTMLRRWELASASWSNVAELNRNNSLQAASDRYQAPSSRQQQQHHHHHSHQLPSRGHANYKSLPTAIVGSKERDRPENRARFDGLQDVGSYHCSSPASLPRHVLEPISQSPTQSLRPPATAATAAAAAAAAAAVVSGVPSTTSIDRYGNGGYSPYNRHDSPAAALIRNSPSNPYVHQFQIQSRNRVT